MSQCSPAIVASIAAALRQCSPCPAAPPVRRWVLADRVPVTRAYPGATVDVMLQGIPVRDTLGRVAHVRGILIRATGVFTAAAEANAAVSAYQLRSLINNVVLQDVSGHYYLPSIESRHMLDDTWARNWAHQQWPFLTTGTQGGAQAPFFPTQTVDYGIPANTPGTIERQIGLYFPFTVSNPDYDPLAGLVPLAGLQQRSSQGAFRFDIQTTIRGVATGLTFDSVENGAGNPGLDVWLDLVYLPAVVSSKWTLDSYTLPENSGVLAHTEAATEHAWIRFFPEDASENAGQALVANLDNYTLSIAGWNELTSNMGSANSMVQRMTYFYASEAMGALARGNAKQDLPILDGSGVIQAMCLVPFRQTGGGEASGPVIFGYGTNPNSQPTRYMHRVNECDQTMHQAELVKASECTPCGDTSVTGRSPSGVSQGNLKGAIVTPVAGVKR